MPAADDFDKMVDQILEENTSETADEMPTSWAVHDRLWGVCDEDWLARGKIVHIDNESFKVVFDSGKGVSLRVTDIQPVSVDPGCIIYYPIGAKGQLRAATVVEVNEAGATILQNNGGTKLLPWSVIRIPRGGLERDESYEPAQASADSFDDDKLTPSEFAPILLGFVAILATVVAFMATLVPILFVKLNLPLVVQGLTFFLVYWVGGAALVAGGWAGFGNLCLRMERGTSRTIFASAVVVINVVVIGVILFLANLWF